MKKNKEIKNLFEAAIQIGMNQGTEVEKGVILNEDYLMRHERDLRKLFQHFCAYPDHFLDIITPTDSSFQLFFYQRIMLRAMMRFPEVYIIACRATSKSFITILAMLLQCILIPNNRRFICAPFKTQSANIAKEKIIEIYDRWPLIKKEVVGCEISDTPGNFGKDYVLIKFKNGSTFEVCGAGDSTRGQRKYG